jgi:hypothetical protein
MTPELSTAFNVVKDTASKPETLVPFDETRQVFLLCDASDDGYGAWLCHLAPVTVDPTSMATRHSTQAVLRRGTRRRTLRRAAPAPTIADSSCPTASATTSSL